MRATASRSARIAPLLVLPLLFAASACTADDGGELEFTDPITLGRALEGRRSL